ncbi:MAG: sulfotransferase domain-containing protein [Nitrospira sp.]|nr:sulfotransferase domain-containing protein [Nitrospira sp.]
MDKLQMLKSLSLAKYAANHLKTRYRHSKTDAYIVSFPKCGRTWLRVLIGKLLCEKFNLPDNIMLDTYRVTTAAGVLRTQVTHDSSAINVGYKYDQLPRDKRDYAGKKVIFLVRNIKDVLVSCYFQATKRIGGHPTSISDFIRSDNYGAKKIVTFYNIWYENRMVPEDFLLLRYEAMHTEPDEALIKTMKFLGLDEVERSLVETAIEFASFQNMKKMEEVGFFKQGIMRPKNIDDQESYKVRKGEIGGYSAYLSEEDISYIDQVIKELGCPFENWGN